MANLIDGGAGTLWRLLLKYNVQDFGFSSKWNIMAADVTAARTKAIEVATAHRRCMPADTEIKFATIANDNSAKDSKLVPEALGVGLFINTGVTPPDTFVDNAFIGVKLRLEADTGDVVSRCVNPLNDGLVEKHSLTVVIPSLTAQYTDVAPVVGTLSDFILQFGNLMKVITKNCIYVKKNHPPGGAFKYSPFVGAHVMGITKKKGGKVFV